MSIEHKALRISVVARAEVNGKFLKGAFPKHISQAEQGSEMNVISPALVRALKLERQALATKGFSGLTMNTADGGVSELLHFVSFEIGVLGIWRKIDAFVRPTKTKDNELDLHLLIGLHWLYAVNARIFIRDSRITLGDHELNEQVLSIQGPEFLQSNTHKLILCPKISQVKNFGLSERVTQENIIEGSDTDSDTSDDTDYSSFDDELPKNVSETAPNQNVSKGPPKIFLYQNQFVILAQVINNKDTSFPTSRRPKLRTTSNASIRETYEWFEKVGIKIGPAVGNQNQLNKVKRLLFTYRDLNGVELEELLPTDLCIHRARLKEGTTPFSKNKQKQWPP